MKPYFHLHFIVLVWALTATLGKIAEMDVLLMVAFRSIVSSIVLIFVALGFSYQRSVGAQGEFSFHKEGFPLLSKETLRYWWPGFWMGGWLGIHWLAFFLAGRVSTATASLVGLGTSPLWALVLAHISKSRHKGATPYDWWIALVAGLAMLIVYLGAGGNWDDVLGVSLSIVAAILAAVVANAQAQHAHTYPSLPYAAVMLLGAGTAVLVIWLIYYLATGHTGPILPGNISGWVSIIALTLFCTAYPYVVMMRVFKNISSFGVLMAINLEPFYGTLIAVAILGREEVMSPLFYVGMGMVIAVSILQGFLASRQPH